MSCWHCFALCSHSSISFHAHVLAVASPILTYSTQVVAPETFQVYFEPLPPIVTISPLMRGSQTQHQLEMMLSDSSKKRALFSHSVYTYWPSTMRMTCLPCRKGLTAQCCNTSGIRAIMPPPHAIYDTPLLWLGWHPQTYVIQWQRQVNFIWNWNLTYAEERLEIPRIITISFFIETVCLILNFGGCNILCYQCVEKLNCKIKLKSN